jgi:hypothetical protein
MHIQKRLFTPIQIGPITLKHRVVMPPMSRLRAQWRSGIPSDLQLEYYRQRASDGGLIFTEATAISTSGRGLQRCTRTLQRRAGDRLETHHGCGPCQGRLHIHSALACWAHDSHCGDGRRTGHGFCRSGLLGKSKLRFRCDSGRLFATVATPGAEDSGDPWNHRAIPHCCRQREATLY